LCDINVTYSNAFVTQQLLPVTLVIPGDVGYLPARQSTSSPNMRDNYI